MLCGLRKFLVSPVSPHLKRGNWLIIKIVFGKDERAWPWRVVKPATPWWASCGLNIASENLLLLLLSCFSRVWLCATPQMAAHQAPPSLGFSRQEHWSGLPFPFPMHETEKWKWSRSVMSMTLSDLMDCNLQGSSIHGICQARVLEWVAVAFSGSENLSISQIRRKRWWILRLALLCRRDAELKTERMIWIPESILGPGSGGLPDLNP